MQVHLPIHQSSGGQVVLQRVDSLLFHHQGIVYDVEHLDDTSRTDISFCHTRIEGVAPQIVETVHIQLARYELVEEVLRVLALEDGNGQVQLPVEVAVDFLHHHQ